jgi:hypothetical protein
VIAPALAGKLEPRAAADAVANARVAALADRTATRSPGRWLRSPCRLPCCAMPLSHRHELTVEWGDCDPAGIVYYPACFRWCNRATYRLFLAAGITRDDTRGGHGRKARRWSLPNAPSVAPRRPERSFRSRATSHGLAAALSP